MYCIYARRYLVVWWCVPVFWRAIPGIMEGPGATLSSSDSATNFQRPRQSSLYNWAGWWWWWWETNRIERKRARNPRLRCNRGIYANRFVCICLTARIDDELVSHGFPNPSSDKPSKKNPNSIQTV